MERLVDLVRASIDQFGSGTEQAIFDTTDAAQIAGTLTDHVASQLGPVETASFYRVGVGVVAGLQTQRGDRVVVKVHRWNASIERLTAVQRVQTHLVDHGLPVPRPLARPSPLARGIATIEELLDADAADGHDASVRRSMASMLCRFVEASRTLSLPELGAPAFISRPGEPLWNEPHDVRFDFDATSEGAGWIDAIATGARTTLVETEPGPTVVGHLDWRTENLGFAGDDVAAIYDWDSLTTADEAVIVGAASAQFCANWRLGHRVPSAAETRLFVEDYETARRRSLTDEESGRVEAAGTLLIAYGARCQHSDQRLRPDLAIPNDDGWVGLLGTRRRPPDLRSPSLSS